MRSFSVALSALNTGLSQMGLDVKKALCSVVATHTFVCFLNLQMVARKSFPLLKPVKLFTLNMHLVRSSNRFF